MVILIHGLKITFEHVCVIMQKDRPFLMRHYITSAEGECLGKVKKEACSTLLEIFTLERAPRLIIYTFEIGQFPIHFMSIWKRGT